MIHKESADTFGYPPILITQAKRITYPPQKIPGRFRVRGLSSHDAYRCRPFSALILPNIWNI